MEEWLDFLDYAIDSRERRKVLHKLKDIIAIVFFAKLANADDWVEFEVFARKHEVFLRKYLELPNGIPSHDTLQRNFAVLDPSFLERLQVLWNEMLSTNEGEKIRKILAIDGKTQRGNGNKNQKANHIVSAVDEHGISVGQKLADDKTNEIKAIPELLDDLNINGHIITLDAMGAQREIVAKIRKKRGDYVIGLKGNQGTLHEDVKLYFEDKELLEKCAYTYKVEKARGGIEKREYWQTDDVSWLTQKEKWAGLKSIGMTRNTIVKDNKTTTETRFFISSLQTDAELFAKAVRGHWIVESFHWHLDVTFREDANQTLDKRAAYNLNIINKMALNVLKLVELSGMKPMSLKKKRYAISLDFEGFMKDILMV
jgi:predicted transposase YbfD/YdcC